MDRFRFTIKCKDAARAKAARAALEDSPMKVNIFGPGWTRYQDAPGAVQELPNLYIQVEADDTAQTRVREIVGPDCEVGPAEPVDD